VPASGGARHGGGTGQGGGTGHAVRRRAGRPGLASTGDQVPGDMRGSGVRPLDPWDPMSAPHRDLRLVLLVAAGGMVGTSARYALTRAVPAHGGWPWATFTENMLGSFLLGLLLEALLRRGPESARGRLVRLGVGTGVLGGFTTFSSLALDAEQLLAHGAVLDAVTYAAASLVGGVVVCLLGVRAAALRTQARGGSGAP